MTTFGYWNIRGLGEPVRLMLHYFNEQFEDVRYQQGEGPEFSREEWFSVKDTLGLDFPNLPYYIDGDVKLTESVAIMLHIANKHGSTLVGNSYSHMIMGVVVDFRERFTRLCYSNEFNERRQKYLDDLVPKLKKFSDFLGDKEFITGDLSYADFAFAESLDSHLEFEPTVLDNFENLKLYLQRFYSLPGIAEYKASDKFKARPLNNVVATFK